MKLQISTNDDRLITSDELNKSSGEIYQILSAAFDRGTFIRFFVKEIPTIVPFGVLNTSIIQIIE